MGLTEKTVLVCNQKRKTRTTRKYPLLSLYLYLPYSLVISKSRTNFDRNKSQNCRVDSNLQIWFLCSIRIFSIFRDKSIMPGHGRNDRRYQNSNFTTNTQRCSLWARRLLFEIKS